MPISFASSLWPDDDLVDWGEDGRTWEAALQANTGYEKAKPGVNRPVGKVKAILHERRWRRQDEYADRPYLTGRLYHDVVDKLEVAITERSGMPIADDDRTPLFIRFELVDKPEGRDLVWHMRLYRKQPPRRAG